jgi:protein-S-isoprenylcysteine O-methyltransferase Ste14
MDSVTTVQLLTICLLWLGFFLLHSLTASLTLKRWVARHYVRVMPVYRILFNLLSGLLLIPVVLLSYHWRSEPLWYWSPALFWLTTVVAVVTIVAFFFSTRYYDMAEFFGLRQWRERNTKAEDQEQFVIGEFHRFVRHPWYSMAIVLIWCREHDPIMLANAIMITLYFVIGSRFEERKLLQYHGDVYRRYRERVPALLPRPWRYLTRAEAEMLLTER